MNRMQTDPAMPGGIGSALLLLGDKWNLLMLQQAFLRHVRRFADWRDALGMADSVLSTRIRELVAAGVLTPAEYRTSGRGRTEYLLTPKALPLWEFLIAIWAWEQAWSDTDTDADAVADAPAARLLHLPCQESTVPELGCRSCTHAPLTARQTSVVTGPDATFGNVAVPRHHRRTVRDRAPIEHTFQSQTLEILGDRWSTVLLVAAFLRVRRFADFQHELGIAPGVLSDRLGRFVELGVLAQRRGLTERDEYRLTTKGLAFFPVFAFLVDWAQEWYPPSRTGRLTIVHDACGQPLQPMLCCTGCRKPLARTEVRFDLGP